MDLIICIGPFKNIQSAVMPSTSYFMLCAYIADFPFALHYTETY